MNVHSRDPVQEEARKKLEIFFENRREDVFFSRQVEVHHENEFFHWVTNRALHDLIETDFLHSRRQALKTGSSIMLIWHRRYRYYKRKAEDVVHLVEEYSDSNIARAIGDNGEKMVLEGFARLQFVMKGRNTRQYGNRRWTQTKHDLDFIFERDSTGYGIEVKNALGYMEDDERKIKMKLCEKLRVRPVFVVRMMPRIWINEVQKKGGFVLVLKYQLYPLSLTNLAKRMHEKLGLPTGAPRVLEDGTMRRFEKWHEKNV